MIKLENVSFSYNNKKKVLNNLNIEFKKGEITIIIGKNGSGKTTICNLLGNFLKYQGNIYLDDLNFKKIKNIDFRKKVGIVFQNPNNQIIFNRVIDDLNFTLDNLNIKDKDKITSSLERLNMLSYLNSNPYELSLGEKQRINFATLLAINPDYFILDETTSMIDNNGKNIIYNLIKELKKENKAIIMTTNIIDELLLADRILILEDGIIKHIILKKDLFNNLDKLKEVFPDLSFKIKVLDILKDKLNYFEDDEVINLIGNICKQ